MSETSTRLLFVFIDVILPLVIGYHLHKYNIMPLRICNLLLKLNVRFIVTVLGFGSFWLIKLDENIFFLAFLGIVLCTILPGGLLYPFLRNRLKDPNNIGGYLLTSMLSNTGTLGGLCAFIAMGQLAYAYVQIVAMAQNIFTLLYCFPLAEYFHQKHAAASTAVKFKPHWRSILISWNQIGLISMAIGALFNYYEIPKPDLFNPVFNSFVHIGAWIGILPVGYLINFKVAKIYHATSYLLIPLRFIIVPIACYLSARFFTDNPLIIAVSLLMGLCPTGANPIAICQLYKLNTNIATANFLINTVIFIVVIYPLFVIFFVP